MSERIPKVNNLIKQELGKLLLQEVDFPKGTFATISRVETSSDLLQARVFLNIFPQESSALVLKILASRIFRLQQMLNGKLRMKKVPKIKFEIDKAEEYADKIEELLGKIEGKNQQC